VIIYYTSWLIYSIRVHDLCNTKYFMETGVLRVYGRMSVVHGSLQYSERPVTYRTLRRPLLKTSLHCLRSTFTVQYLQKFCADMPTSVLIAYLRPIYIYHIILYGRQPVQGNVDAACEIFGFVKALMWASQLL